MRVFRLAGAALAASLVLSGCIIFPPAPPSAQGCEVQFQQGGTWSIAGLTIPINHPLIGSIKVGNVSYTGADYSKITETIRILDQARLGYCSLTTSPNFPQLTQEVKNEIFQKAAASYTAIVNFGTGLRTATTPQQGIEAQQEADKKAKEVSQPLSATFIDKDARAATAALTTRVEDLTTKVGQLGQDLERATSPTAQRVQVKGFEPNGEALAADQRTAVLADFRKAIAAVPAHRTPTVLFIGYGDGSGAQSNGADLALRRATNVAEFLRRHEFGRDFQSQVTIGSVASQASGENARRVDIVVSRVAMALQDA